MGKDSKWLIQFLHRLYSVAVFEKKPVKCEKYRDNAAAVVVVVVAVAAVVVVAPLLPGVIGDRFPVAVNGSIRAQVDFFVSEMISYRSDVIDEAFVLKVLKYHEKNAEKIELVRI